MLLGLFLLIFHIYPPVSLFFRGGNPSSVLSAGSLGLPLLNSLKLSVSVFVFTASIGGILAVISVRLNPGLRRIIDGGVIISFALPPYVLALAWMQIAGRNGYFERIMHHLGIGEGWHSNPYSLGAAALIMSLHLYPLMYMALRNALEKLPPQLEQAALLAGASLGRTIVEISIPALLPAALSTGLLIFSRTMANFSVPALLCLPAGIDLVPTGIYSALSGLKTSEAALLSLVLVGVSTALHIAHGLLLNKKAVVSAEKGASVRSIGPGRKMFSTSAVLLFFTLACAVPLASMAVSSLLLRWGLPVERQYLTLENYRQILSGGGPAARAFANSLFFGAAAALLAGIAGGGAAVLATKLKPAAGRLLEAAAGWPMAVPNTVLAVAAIYAWNRPPLRLYGSRWCIIITYMVLFTPIMQKQITAVQSVIDNRLLDAARTSGAGGFTAFLTVSLPMVLPGFVSGTLICMMIALREIPISLMLYSAGQETVGVLLFGMQSQSYGLEMTSALSIVLIAVIIGGNRLLEGIGRRFK